MMKFDKRTRRSLIIIICGVILFNYLLNNSQVIPQTVNYIINLLMPFIVGCVIAFIVNVPMKIIESFLLRKTKMKPKLARVIALLLAIIIVLGIVVFVVFMIAPAFVNALVDLFNALPSIFSKLSESLTDFLSRYPQLTQQIATIQEDITIFVEDFLKNLSTHISLLIGILSATIGTIMNLFIGFVFAIYVLLAKEPLKHQIRKIIYALLPVKRARQMVDFWSLTNHIFTQFFTGQVLEAFINGGLFFLVTTLFNMPYRIVISVFLGFAALIPYFGALIGTMVGVLLVMSQSFSQAILFGVLAIIIQQIDGNVIYPRVVGNQIGLPAIWVLVAVTLGASLWGIVGMVVMVPLASVFYTLFAMWVNHRLNQKSVDVSLIKDNDIKHLFSEDYDFKG